MSTHKICFGAKKCLLNVFNLDIKCHRSTLGYGFDNNYHNDPMYWDRQA